MDPEQTAPIGASLIWVHNVCHRGFLNISADEKSRLLLLPLVHLGLIDKNVIKQVIKYNIAPVTGPRSAVLALGLRPWCYTVTSGL